MVSFVAKLVNSRFAHRRVIMRRGGKGTWKAFVIWVRKTALIKDAEARMMAKRDGGANLLKQYIIRIVEREKVRWDERRAKRDIVGHIIVLIPSSIAGSGVRYLEEVG